MALSRCASADARASTRNGQNPSRRASNGRPRRTSIRCSPICPTACHIGSKKNSKGYKETWIGYKLHLDVTCGQIPVSCVLTSASVHDSQVAIPLMTMTGGRVSYLYDLTMRPTTPPPSMTTARRSAMRRSSDFRAQHEAKAEWAKEVERMKLIHMPDPDDVIFDFRTLAERVNARLKDEFGARSVRVRGAIKVKCHLMFGVVALAVDQILRVMQLRPAPA